MAVGACGPTVKEEGKMETFVGTLKDAITKNTPMKCESAMKGGDNQEANMSGIIQGNQYVGRIDVNGKIGNVLMKDNCMWTWQEGAKSGVKTCFEPTQQDGDESWGNFDSKQLNESVNCSPTMISPGTFLPPTNVSFLDIDELDTGNLTEEQLKQLGEMSVEE